MKRSELYSRVWQTPMRVLGPELGLSDVGLAKLCRRHRVPVPPVGYWAKLAAGKAVTRPPLPPLDSDESVIAPLSPRDIARRAAAMVKVQEHRAAEKRNQADVAIEEICDVRPTLEGCHALVRKTERFFSGIEPAIAKHERERAAQRGGVLLSWLSVPRANCGRYSPTKSGALRISASLANVDWILRFHDALLQSLERNGCKVHAADCLVQIVRGCEAVGLKFSEDYTKGPARKGDLFGSPTYVAKNSYKLTMERAFTGAKEWRGDAAKLQELLPSIVHAFAVALDAQASRRAIAAVEEVERARRDAEGAEQQRQLLEAQRLRDERIAAQRDAIQKAIDAGKAAQDFRAIESLLAQLEVRGARDDAVMAWVHALRGIVKDPVDVLIDAIRQDAKRDRAPWWAEPLPPSQAPGLD